MEKLKVKHDHSLTDILKVLIFAIVLLIPGFMFLPSMLYFGMNEQANAPTKEVQIVENIEVDFNQQIKNGNFETTYNWYNVASAYGTFVVSDNTMYYTPTGQNGGFAQRPMLFKNGHQYLFNVNCINLVNNYSMLCYDDGYNRFACSSKGITAGTTGLINYITTMNVEENSNIRFTLACTNNSNFGTSSFKDIMIFDLTQMGLEDININTFLTMFPNEYYEQTYSRKEYYYNVTTETQTVVDITTQLEYNWEQIWQKPILSWTNVSILKEGLDKFTGVFGIVDNSYITNLITYELIMVGVYIVIDIVLTLFKWLTHMIGNK